MFTLSRKPFFCDYNFIIKNNVQNIRLHLYLKSQAPNTGSFAIFYKPNKTISEKVFIKLSKKSKAEPLYVK
jgi:hypothetical protein